MHDDPTILEHHALIVHQQRIIDILPSDQVPERYHSEQTQTLDQHVLMPGLINCHGHAAMSLLRGYADDMELMQWLENHIWPAEGKHVDESFVYQGTQLAIAEMLLSGTTCFSDMYLFPDQAAQAALHSGIKAQLSFPVFNVPTIWAKSIDEYLEKGLALLDEYRSQDTIQIAFGPHAPYTVDDKALERVSMLASELDNPIQMHIHETAFEVEQALAENKQRPLERLHQFGLLSPKLQAVHCTQLSESDIELLALTQSHVIHCPESNMKLASGICPINNLMNAGINVALGTDGAASNNDLDLFCEMRSASLLAKVSSQSASAVDAYQSLKMATINGAKALGLEQEIGSLDIGKSADFIALNLERIEAQPIHNIISLICYSNAAPWVEHVWVNGKQRVHNRQLLSMDQTSIIKHAQQWQQRLQMA